MKPYVADSQPIDNAANDQANHIPSSSRLPDSLYEYDLFCVVTHEGKLDNGHYWADVLSEGEWWHCDDDKGACMVY